MIIVLNITISLHKSKFNAVNAITLQFLFTFTHQLINSLINSLVFRRIFYYDYFQILRLSLFYF